jgi:hypothetical protein
MPHNQPKRGGYLRVSQFSTALYPVTLFNRYLQAIEICTPALAWRAEADRNRMVAKKQINLIGI